MPFFVGPGVTDRTVGSTYVTRNRLVNRNGIESLENNAGRAVYYAVLS